MASAKSVETDFIKIKRGVVTTAGDQEANAVLTVTSEDGMRGEVDRVEARYLVSVGAAGWTATDTPAIDAAAAEIVAKAAK